MNEDLYKFLKQQAGIRYQEALHDMEQAARKANEPEVAKRLRFVRQEFARHMGYEILFGQIGGIVYHDDGSSTRWTLNP